MAPVIGTREVCATCGQDIEYHGNRQWLDRGGNRSCVTYFSPLKQEYVKPKGKHKPPATGKLLASGAGGNLAQQHTKPCSDCPWTRTSVPGWLGPETTDSFLQIAHGDNKYPCHVHCNQQCAGMAIYRQNVCKSPRDPTALRLPADEKTVFGTPSEFRSHHEVFK